MWWRRAQEVGDTEVTENTEDTEDTEVTETTEVTKVTEKAKRGVPRNSSSHPGSSRRHTSSRGSAFRSVPSDLRRPSPVKPHFVRLTTLSRGASLAGEEMVGRGERVEGARPASSTTTVGSW